MNGGKDKEETTLTAVADVELVQDFPFDLAVSDLRGDVRTFRELYKRCAHRQSVREYSQRWSCERGSPGCA